MKVHFSFKSFSLLLLFFPILVFPILPVKAYGGESLPTFNDFIATVSDGRSGVVSGVYVPGVLADKVTQQSANNPGYISPAAGVVTQFSMAVPFGVIGLLAHNVLAGGNFNKLEIGQEVRIIFGDGNVELYTIRAINRYKAINSHSLISSFRDLITGKIYSAAQVFEKYYQGGDQVTFQTCIAQGGDLSWGRIFITAAPMASIQPEVVTANIPQYLLPNK
jgi:hypothetical protein